MVNILTKSTENLKNINMRNIDDIDKIILSHLIRDAKMSYNLLAQKIGISNAAIYKRIAKMKAQKIIVGSTINIDLKKLGYYTCAFIGIQVLLTKLHSHEQIFNKIKEIPEIIESHHISGKYSLLIKLVARDNEHLKNLIVSKIQSIDGVVSTETFISLEKGFVRNLDVKGLL